MYPDPTMQPMLGSSHYPPSFSYAQATPHAQHRGGAYAGNVLVSGGIGAAHGMIEAGQMGVMGAGLVHAGSAGLKALGLMRAPVLASGFIGTGATSGLAAGLVGGPVGLSLMAAGAVASAGMHGVQTANQVGAMFGNMQFANAGGDPRTGRGFSQRDLMTLQRGIHNIEANNPFVSMSDAMRAADRFTEMGMQQGLQDAEKLAKKVTQLGKTMHAMARQLGTSMEEAGAIFKDMRGAGFYSAQDVMGNTANMTLMRGFGMTSDQFAGMQRAGAGMTRSAMMSGKAGASVVTSKTAEFMSAIRSGVMDANQMMDMTGASTPLEAAQMLAQQTLSGTMQGLSGGLGTAMLLAAGQTDKSGKFTGEVDAGILQKMATGSMTRDEMNRLGGRKRDSREGQASFVARKQDITESMLESEMGQEALFGMIRSLTEQQYGAGSGDDQDLFQLVAETQFNMDRRTVRNLQKLKDTRAQRLRDLAQELKTNERAAELKENYTLGGLYQKISGTVEDAYESATMPFSEYYRDVTAGLQDVERLMLGGGQDVTMGVSEQGMQDALIANTIASAKGAGIQTDSKLSIGDAARLSAIRNDVGIMRSALPDLGGQEQQVITDLRSRGLDLKTMSGSLLERGRDLNSIEGKILVKGLTMKYGLTDDQAQNIIAKEGGDSGLKLVAQANVNRFETGDSNQDLIAAQDSMANALGAGSLLARATDSRAPVRLFEAALFAYDSKEEKAIEAVSSGGEATRLLSQYGTSHAEIDRILVGANSDADFEDRAEKLNRIFGTKLKGADVKSLNQALTHKFKGTASHRLNSVTAEDAKSIARSAVAIEEKVAAKKQTEALEALRGAATSAGITLSKGDDESAIGDAIKQLAAKDFRAGVTNTAAEQTLGFGVEAFRSLEMAKQDGLTVQEVRESTKLSDETIKQIIGGGLGSVNADGKITATDTNKLVQQLAGYATKNLAISAKQEQFLNAGMSETERQSLSVYKTAEMVDALWSKLKTEGVIKVADPAGNTSGNGASESRPPAGARPGG